MAWKTVRLSDIPDVPVKTGPHKPRMIKCISRLYCTQCGLVKLKNGPSRKAWRAKCRY